MIVFFCRPHCSRRTPGARSWNRLSDRGWLTAVECGDCFDFIKPQRRRSFSLRLCRELPRAVDSFQLRAAGLCRNTAGVPLRTSCFCGNVFEPRSRLSKCSGSKSESARGHQMNALPTHTASRWARTRWWIWKTSVGLTVDSFVCSDRWKPCFPPSVQQKHGVPRGRRCTRLPDSFIIRVSCWAPWPPS